jgi:hypothetical protein
MKVLPVWLSIVALAVALGGPFATPSSAGDASEAGLSDLIEILRSKGVLSRHEADAIDRRIAEVAALPPPPPRVEMPPGDVKAAIDGLRQQGILVTDEEAAGLAGRVRGPGDATPLPEASGPVLVETASPTAQATMGPAYLRAMIDILRAQEVVSEPEAAVLYRRAFRGRDAAGERSVRQARPMAKPASVLPPQPSRIEMREDDVKAVVYGLREQGILSEREAQGMDDRILPPGTERPATPPPQIVFEEAEIPYARTTQPPAYIRAMIDILRAQGVASDEDAVAMRARLVRKGPSDRVAEGVSREVAALLPAEVKKQVAPAAKSEVERDAQKRAVPDWAKRFTLSGDLRLRTQADMYGKGNATLLRPDKPDQVLNTSDDRYRLRLRARLGVKAMISETLDANLRLATGNLTDPVSTNQTLGEYWNKKSFVLEQGYLRWTPSNEWIVAAGRIPNPFFATDLVWDADLNFDGVSATFARHVAGRFGAFATAGVFPLQEEEFSTKDKWLFAGQAGTQWRPTDNVSVRAGASYYHFRNVVGTPNDPTLPNQQDFTAPLFQQKGNTLFDIDPSTAIKTALVSEFREVELTMNVDLGWFDPVHFVFVGDYVRNIGFDRGDVEARTGVTGVPEETDGWLLGVAVGHPTVREAGDWKGFFFYKRLEADAVIDAFTDSDFHLGGTNAKGFTVGGEYGLMRNVWLSGRWHSADEVSGGQLSIDVFQLDLNVRF